MTDGLKVNLDVPKTSWKLRRAYLFLTTIFFMAIVVYCLVTNKDSKVAETAVMFSMIAISINVMAYVFGAIKETQVLTKALTGSMTKKLKL